MRLLKILEVKMAPVTKSIIYHYYYSCINVKQNFTVSLGWGGAHFNQSADYFLYNIAK